MKNKHTINILTTKERYSIPLLKVWFDDLSKKLNSKIYFIDNINQKDINLINNSFALFIYVDCPINIFQKIDTKIILYQDFPLTKNDVNFVHEIKKYKKKILFLTHKIYKKFLKSSVEFGNFFPTIIKEKQIKKDIDLLILYGEPKVKFTLNNIFLILIAKNLINFYGDFINEIEKSILYNFLFKLSFKNKYEKINFIYRYIKLLRRKFIIDEVEQIGNNINIFYYGSNKYFPKNIAYKSKFLDNKNFYNILRRTKVIIATTPLVCDTIDERISHTLKFNCLPIFEPYPQNIPLLRNKNNSLSFVYKKDVLKNKIIYLIKNKSLTNSLLNKTIKNINKLKKINPRKYLIKKLKLI
jgi:hypothetical protein